MNYSRKHYRIDKAKQRFLRFGNFKRIRSERHTGFEESDLDPRAQMSWDNFFIKYTSDTDNNRPHGNDSLGRFNNFTYFHF